MTRRHLEAMAAAIRAARQDVVNKEPSSAHADMLDGINLAAEHVIDALREINPSLDRLRFLTDAGVPC